MHVLKSQIGTGWQIFQKMIPGFLPRCSYILTRYSTVLIVVNGYVPGRSVGHGKCGWASASLGLHHLRTSVLNQSLCHFLYILSGIQDGQKIRIRIRDEQPGSYFQELRNHFFGLKYSNSFMRIWDPGWKNPGFVTLPVGASSSVADPWHLGVYPDQDPRIHASD